jgi:GNAT superfamily N-acetyltransferase
MAVSIIAARTDEEIDHARALCRDFERWLGRRYRDELWLIDTYFDPDNWASEVIDLDKVYGPLGGEILLAMMDGEPVGCVMMHSLDEDVCEVKRLFVAEARRGQGLGEALCKTPMETARERGYRLMRLNTGFRQGEAQALYERLGFRRIEPYGDAPERARDVLEFMERRL